MSTTAMTDIALFSKNGQTWQDGTPLTWMPSEAVTKIVVGTLEGELERETPKTVALSEPLPDLAALFPRLTHLHLWCIGNLEVIPGLPTGLRCLDIRHCEHLRTLPTLPETLDTLVLERCPLLTSPARTPYPALQDLSIKGSRTISEEWLLATLAGAPRLRLFDASDCNQLSRVEVWPAELVDLRLNDCTRLESIGEWPAAVRRIELRGATQLRDIPSLGPRRRYPHLDYVDLAGTTGLLRLPEERGAPRTLFLHGSGVLVPPASEHGRTPSENVAQSVASYFADVQLTGPGEVRRCKVLVLGNGSAGKTWLSLAMLGRSPQDENVGSTDGIQFWDWETAHVSRRRFVTRLDSVFRPVHLHLWDFGGQEIYHNTHQLFINKGAVFLIVWNPGQDGKQPARGNDGDYVDEWRRLRYWLDFIRVSCPHQPRIAIVCSHTSRGTEQLESRWRSELPPELERNCECFYIDSATRTGDLGRLEEWLKVAVGEVIVAQGQAVPSYWEVAQDMVAAWLKRLEGDGDFARTHSQRTRGEFATDLSLAIDEAISSDATGRFEQIATARQSGEFVLTEDRVQRTLAFLTHSGWVYWDPGLFQGRVIVGQKWALDGLYAVLDRKPESRVFRQLTARDGRFTLSDLSSLAWSALGFSEAEQKLLLTFMERCGLCFRLRSADDSWRDEDVYASFEHLPTSDASRLLNAFDSNVSLEEGRSRIESPMLHELHWKAFLVNAGGRYGKNAMYARDGFFVENKDAQRILALYKPAPGGLGGAIAIAVRGPDASERRNQIDTYIRSFLPGRGLRPDRNDPPVGEAVGHEHVFISYAWNDRPEDDYEKPVDVIEDFLARQQCPVSATPGESRAAGPRLTLTRDKSAMRRGDDILKFMENGAKHPHVIVVHSDKYWQSPNTVFEMCLLLEELRNKKSKSFESVVIPVEHRTSGVRDQAPTGAYAEFWRSYSGRIPRRIPWQKEELTARAAAAIYEVGRLLSSASDLNIPWNGDERLLVSRIAERLNLPVPRDDPRG